MDSNESLQAAKVLIDFIKDFTYLTERQLMAIRGLMEETVQGIMESVNSMSDKADQKKNEATEVMIRDAVTSEFKRSSTHIQEEAAEMSRSVDEGQRRQFLENQLRRAGGVFSKHMEALHKMDSDMQDILFRVMGAVSMDDVMGQRLTHVVSSLLYLKEGISEVVSKHDEFATVQGVTQLRNRILTQVYRSYTTEDEKEIFHKVFGQPKEAKQAS